MNYKGIIALIMGLAAIDSPAQESNGLTMTEGDLCLNFRNISFVRNNEYSNPVTEGYTLIGWFIQPELVYRPAQKAELRLGAHLLRYPGTNGFSAAKPVFSTTWFFSEKTRFTLGSLPGSDTHRMFDPHFSLEKTYKAFSEDGLQFLTEGKRVSSDTWVSWENYIRSGDNEREIFTAGESFRYTPADESSRIRLELPVQILFRHYGGQISDYPEPVETFMNLAAGVKVITDAGPGRKVTAGLEGLAFYGSSMRDNAASGIKDGHALWALLFCSFPHAEFKTGYWTSENYYAPEGNFIFGSVSDHLDNVVVSTRNLITGSLNIRIHYNSLLEFFLGFDGWYDTDLKRFDNALTLHLRIDELIKLTSVKRR